MYNGISVTPNKTTYSTGNPGLKVGRPEFKALSEIAAIAHLTDTLTASVLPAGMTTAQFGVLNHLLRLQTQETISELAAALQVSQPTMSSTVKKLEQKGLSRRISDIKDRRAKRVHVTNTGRRVRDQSVANIEYLRAGLGPEFMAIDWAGLLPQLAQVRQSLDRHRRSQR